MAHLEHSELEALWETLLECCSSGAQADLPTRIYSVLERFFSCDNDCYIETAEALEASRLEVLGLTKREAEVLLWMSLGKRNAEIAQILGISHGTIKKHAERIISKLCVENRTSAATTALNFLRTYPQPERFNHTDYDGRNI